MKDQCRLDIRKCSFSHRTINEWNESSTYCVHAILVAFIYIRTKLKISECFALDWHSCSILLFVAVVPVVDVTKNLALKKPTRQISTQSNAYGSSVAVDGSRANYPLTRCSHTTRTINAWWQVDLVATYEIREVVIANLRDDGCKL